MSDGEDGWRIARFSAWSALGGAGVGALASVVIALVGFERQEDLASRARKEQVHVEFLQEAERFEFTWRYGDSVKRAGPPGDVETLDHQHAILRMYAPGDVRAAASDVVGSLSRVVGALGDKGDVDWSSYDDAVEEYIVAVRDDLETD